MPSPGGQVSGMVPAVQVVRGEVDGWRARHPVDLPEGYHTARRAQAWHDRR